MSRSRAILPILYITLLAAAWPLSGRGVRDGSTIWWAPQFEYDSKRTEMLLSGRGNERAWIEQEDARILADRIYWNRNTRIGRCYDRVEIISFTNDSVITGNEAWHYSESSHTIVRGNPKLSMRRSKIDVYGEELHRFGSDSRSEAYRNVRIESEDGTAFGEKAVYYQRIRQIVLSEDPWIVQEENTHRAEVITLFQDEDRVLLRGRARMMDGADFILANEIEIIDCDQTNERPANSGNAGTDGDDTNERRNRVIFCRGDVRIYRFTNRGVLESITTGDFGELYERRGYVRLTGRPRMVMVSDNTMTSGSVMEQFRDDNRAVVRGNANITKGHRSVDAQLIIYNTETKIAEITGNPIIREFDDNYRADYVLYDTATDVISWRGSTMAVIGIAHQRQKEQAWLSRMGAGVFTLPAGANGLQVINSVGDVWLSMNGTPRTNNGVVNFGKRADAEDFIPRGTHIVIPDTWSWVDLLGRDGKMVRLRGPAHLVLSAASWGEAPAASASETAAGGTQAAAGGTQAASGGTQAASGGTQAASGGTQATAGGTQAGSAGAGASSSRGGDTAPQTGNLRSFLDALREEDSARNKGIAPVPAEDASASQPAREPVLRGEDIARTLITPVVTIVEGILEDMGDEIAFHDTRFGLTSWTLHHGIMLVRPGRSAATDIMHKNFSCTNITVPFLIEADREERVRIVTLENQANLFAWARLPVLGNITLRDDGERRDFNSHTEPAFRQAIPVRTPMTLRLGQITTSEELLHRRITNALTNRMIELSNIAATNIIEQIEESPLAVTNRSLMQVPYKNLIDHTLRALTSVAATNTPGQPFTLNLISEKAETLPAELRPEVYWEGSLRAFVLDTLRGKSFWAREALPRRQTDFNDLIQETEGLNIRYGPQRRPAGRDGI
jgi:lipopolysaccharide export system protein LptA